MKILKITFITLAVLALAGWFFLFRSVPLKVSPETTILTEPRTEDGKWVDYRAYLIAQFPKDGNTEKNSARGMLELFGLEGEYAPTFKPEYWEMLGLEPPDENQKAPFSISFDFMRNEKFVDCEKVEDYFAADPEAVREYVSAATPALDAMVEVIQKAEFYAFPLVASSPDDLISALMPDISTLHEIARVFEFRAWLREKDGDQEGADADRLVLLKFGRQMQNEAVTIVTLLVGKKIEKMGADLKDPEKWKTLEPINREENLQRVLEIESLFVPGVIQNASRTGRMDGFADAFRIAGEVPDDLFGWSLTHLGIDWNVVAMRLNETTQKVYFPEENAAPFEIPRYDSGSGFLKLLSRRARSKILADFLARTLTLYGIPELRQRILEEVPAPAP